jgi:hypothetical protein
MRSRPFLESPMNTGKTLFAQLMDFLPWKDLQPDCRPLRWRQPGADGVIGVSSRTVLCEMPSSRDRAGIHCSIAINLNPAVACRKTVGFCAGRNHNEQLKDLTAAT